MEAQEIKIVEKRLSKYTTDQLLKKVETNSFLTPEENQIAINILKKRGRWGTVAEVESSVPETKEIESLPTDEPKIEDIKEVELPEPEMVVEPEKEKTISQIIDDIYDLKSKEVNNKLASLFPRDLEFDGYEELPSYVKKAIVDFHDSLFNKVAKKTEPVTKTVKEKVTKDKGVSSVPQTKKSAKTEATEDVKLGESEITDAHVKVGDMAKFLVANNSRTEAKKELVGLVKRVYMCPRVHKEYVKLVVDNKVYFKRLNLVTLSK